MPIATGQAELERKRQEWTRWVLAFSHTDLSRLTKTEWQALKQKIGDFCVFALAPARSSGRVTVASEKLWRKSGEGLNLRLSQEEVRGLQRTLREGLATLFPDPEREDLGAKGIIGARTWRLPASIRGVELSRLAILKPSGRGKMPGRKHRYELGEVFWSYDTGWPDVFWTSVGNVLRQYSRRIKKCGLCERHFLKRKRQTYCSAKCSQKTRGRRWYAAHHEEVRRKRHVAYVRLTKKEHPRAKVQRRRPRRTK